MERTKLWLLTFAWVLQAYKLHVFSEPTHFGPCQHSNTRPEKKNYNISQDQIKVRIKKKKSVGVWTSIILWNRTKTDSKIVSPNMTDIFQQGFTPWNWSTGYFLEINQNQHILRVLRNRGLWSLWKFPCIQVLLSVGTPELQVCATTLRFPRVLGYSNPGPLVFSKHFTG